MRASEILAIIRASKKIYNEKTQRAALVIRNNNFMADKKRTIKVISKIYDLPEEEGIKGFISDRALYGCHKRTNPIRYEMALFFWSRFCGIWDIGWHEL